MSESCIRLKAKVQHLKLKRWDEESQPVQNEIITKLMGITKIFKNENTTEVDISKYQHSIHQLYYWLLENPSQVPAIIMKIVVTCPLVQIIFILDRDDTEMLKINYSIANVTNSGETYCGRAKIIVAAKKYLMSGGEIHLVEVAGKVIHELGHYALHLTYANESKPYTRIDLVGKTKCKEILEKSNLRRDAEDIIKTAFEAYSEENTMSELVVRCVEFLTIHQDDEQRAENFKENFKALHSFYTETVIKDFKDEHKKLLAVEKITETYQIHKEMAQLEAISTKKTDTEISFKKFLVTNNIYLALNFIFHKNKMELNLINLVFSSLGHILKNNEENFETFVQASTRKNKPLMLVDCRDLSFNEILKFSKRDYLPKNICLVVSRGQGFSESELENYSTLDFFWDELSFDCQKKYSIQKVKFQSREREIPFTLITGSQNRTENFKISMVPDNLRTVEIDKRVKKFSKLSTYVERKYELEDVDGQMKIVELDEVLMNEYKLLLLSNTTGMGKSIEMRQMYFRLKENYPNYWIEFADLKDFPRIFESLMSENIENFDILADLLSKYFIKIIGFERDIFIHLLGDERVIFIFDSMNELSPRYYDIVIKLLKAIMNLTGCNIFLSTRPHLLEKTRTEINCLTVLKLCEVGAESRKDMLQKIFHAEFSTYVGTDREQVILDFLNKKEVSNPLLIDLIIKTLQKKACNMEEISLFNMLRRLKSEMIEVVYLWGSCDLNAQEQRILNI